MEVSGASTPTPAVWWRQPLSWAIALLLIIDATGLARHMNAYGGGPDPSGYLNNARLLAQGKLRVAQMRSPGLDEAKFDQMTFIPLSFRPVGKGEMIDCYSTGLPMAVLGIAQITGWNLAPHAAMLLASLLGIVATAWLGIETGLPRHWAWFASLVLAASPLYIHMSLMLMSDVPALVCVTCAMALAWKSRTRDAWALLCGAAVTYAVFTRPANAIVLAPVAVCLGFAWRRWLYLGITGLPGAAAWCLCNHGASGHYLETGYGNMSMYFSLATAPVTLGYYAHWLPVLFSPWGLFAIGLPWLVRRGSPAAMLIVWIVTFLGFYSVYTFTHSDWQSSRFLLPALPACLVGGVMVIRRLLETAGGRKFSAACARLGSAAALLWVVPVILYGVVFVIRLKPQRLVEFQGVYPAAAQWADDHIPANAVVLGKQMTGAFYYYTKFDMLREDSLKPAQWSEVVRVCAAAHRPLYAAILYPYDLPPLDKEAMLRKDWVPNVGDFLEAQFPGKWTQTGRINAVTFWRFEQE